MLDREFEHGDDSAMQIFGALPGKAIGPGARVHACGEQRFVSIYVADARDERLIQEKGLDMPFVPLQSFKKFSEIDRERVRPGPLKNIGQFVKEFKPSELANIIIDKDAGVELEHGARKLARHRIPEQFAGHSEVHIQDTVPQFEIDLLAAAMNTADRSAREAFDRLAKISPRDPARRDGSMPDRVTKHVRSK
jgi:hypothetical protein